MRALGRRRTDAEESLSRIEGVFRPCEAPRRSRRSDSPRPIPPKKRRDRRLLRGNNVSAGGGGPAGLMAGGWGGGISWVLCLGFLSGSGGGASMCPQPLWPQARVLARLSVGRLGPAARRCLRDGRRHPCGPGGAQRPHLAATRGGARREEPKRGPTPPREASDVRVAFGEADDGVGNRPLADPTSTPNRPQMRSRTTPDVNHVSTSRLPQVHPRPSPS